MSWLVVAFALALQQGPPIRDGWTLPALGEGAARVKARGPARLLVVPLEWEDLRAPAALGVEHFEALFFSRNVYGGQNRARQQVFGSAADWVAQCSYELSALSGRAMPWTRASGAWKDVGGWDEGRVHREIARLVERAADEETGRDFAATDHAMVYFMGSREELPAGHALRRTILTVRAGGRDVSTLLIESGMTGTETNVARGAGSVVRALAGAWGVVEHPSAWCAAARADVERPYPAAASEHRPPLLCAPCRMKLGWLVAPRLDGAHRLALRPVSRYPDAAALGDVIVENRQRIGFDRTLPAPGVLMWRVTGGTVDQVPGRAADAPRFPSLVPLPSARGVGRGPIADVTFDENGVAYVTVGGAPAGAITFEGETYTPIPEGAQSSVDTLGLGIAFVEFEDIAHASVEPEAVRKYCFDPSTPGAATYFAEASGGRVRLRGAVAPRWVKLAAKRDDVAKLPPEQRQRRLLTPAAAGVDLRGVDALLIVAAGLATPPALAPHQGTFDAGGRNIPYALVPEGAALRDVAPVVSLLLRGAGLSGRAATTAGDKAWCAAGATSATRERVVPGPTLPCAWCREQLGWMRPHDARQGRFAMGPVAAYNAAIRVPVRAGEYYLLENRARWDFDRGLPREGVVVWHVTPADGRCTSCAENGVLDVWLVHEPPQGQAPRAGRYEPWTLLPKKGLSLRLGASGVELTGVKIDARGTAYFELDKTDGR